MISNLKALGLALLAILAMSAVAASVASAEKWDFKSDGEPTKFTGEQIKVGELADVFQIEYGIFACEKITTSGEQVAGTAFTSINLTPVYTNCERITGGGKATYVMNGCTYTLTAETVVNKETTGSTSIDCPGGKEVEITVTVLGVTACTIRIPAQGPISKVTFTTGAGANKDIHYNAVLSGIKYTETAGTGFAKCTTASKSNGKFESTTTIKGDNKSGGVTDIWVDDTPGT